MEALGQIVVYLFYSALVVGFLVLVCIVGIIYNFIKAPKESTRRFLSFMSGAIFTATVGYLTKSLWFNLNKQPELAVGGLFACLVLTLFITYFLDRFLLKNKF